MVTDPIYEHFRKGFGKATHAQADAPRRIGAELKFPLVTPDGAAASLETVRALWDYLHARGWQPDTDSMTGEVIGARRRGEHNDTVASCETGYCKTEFSLAHAADLFGLDVAIRGLMDELRPFAEEHDVQLLGYGIQPVTPPSQRLLMKKSRTGVWDQFASNHRIPPQDGVDMHLFTINAASHVHVSVSAEEAIPAVNVLNGFTGAQIALNAHSNVWRGQLDSEYKCVSEMFWDWWMPDGERVGIPAAPFENLRHYVHTIARLRPVYVKRDGVPIVLPQYDSFAEYYSAGEPMGEDMDGNAVALDPSTEDIDVHSTCYWYNARLSRYYTVENRVNDQQPPQDLICIAALTLGLVSALAEAQEVLARHEWSDLRAAREQACRHGLAAAAEGVDLAELAGEMLSVARVGLLDRRIGEEIFLDPLFFRHKGRYCPADTTAELFTNGGVDALIAARAL